MHSRGATGRIGRSGAIQTSVEVTGGVIEKENLPISYRTLATIACRLPAEN